MKNKKAASKLLAEMQPIFYFTEKLKSIFSYVDVVNQRLNSFIKTDFTAVDRKLIVS